MSKIFVSGLITYETNVSIERFPLPYFPVCYPFFGINSSVSGVGFNVASALKKLGDNVSLYSLIGNDPLAELLLDECCLRDIDISLIHKKLDSTSQSVIFVDALGRRQIHCDLKNIQELQTDLPNLTFLNECSLFVACNINFSRPLLAKAKELGKIIATDCHAIRDVNDAYNAEFMANADILFLSDEKIEGDIYEFITAIYEQYHNKVIVVGRGHQGSILYYNEQFTEVESVAPRQIINTVGAGDALFSCFLHYYAKTQNPLLSLQKATLFAGYKIGENGGSIGFLSEAELDELFEVINNARTR